MYETVEGDRTMNESVAVAIAAGLSGLTIDSRHAICSYLGCDLRDIIAH